MQYIAVYRMANSALEVPHPRVQVHTATAVALWSFTCSHRSGAIDVATVREPKAPDHPRGRVGAKLAAMASNLLAMAST